MFNLGSNFNIIIFNIIYALKIFGMKKYQITKPLKNLKLINNTHFKRATRVLNANKNYLKIRILINKATAPCNTHNYTTTRQ